MNNNALTPESRRRLVMLAAAVAIAFVLVPYLFWRQTWFGRPLGETEIGSYLNDEGRPRRIQHALAQLSEHMARRDPGAGAYYARVVELASHPLAEIRTTVAWLMGQDNTSEAFHRALLTMVRDPDLMVRRNAALALIRFHDAAGRMELLAMLQPYEVGAPAAGRVTFEARPNSEAGRGRTVARITTAQGTEVRVRSPAAGEVSAIRVANGAQVQTGTPLLSLAPEPDQAWEALRGLYLVGEAEDVRTVERYEAGPRVPERVREQAAFTARAIRTRSVPSPNR